MFKALKYVLCGILLFLSISIETKHGVNRAIMRTMLTRLIQHRHLQLLSSQKWLDNGKDVKDAIVDGLQNAKTSVCCAMYVLTDEKILSEMLAAAERGVRVDVIVDESQCAIAACKLANRPNISFLVDTRSKGCMHLKLWVIDKAYFIAGSSNATHAAEYSNAECMIKDANPITISRMESTFENLKKGIEEQQAKRKNLDLKKEPKKLL